MVLIGILLKIPERQCSHWDFIQGEGDSSENRPPRRRPKHYGGEGFGGHPLIPVLGGGKGR